MPVSITAQPATDSLNAAYRPIVITVTGSNPVVYCDIYFGDTYYKTLSKTQAPYNFDIQNAAQEYLKKYLAPVNGAGIYNAASLITDCYVQVRGSVLSPEGFITPDAPIPVQATGTTAAAAGGGTRSNGFYIINSSLQHGDNQNLAAHLNAYKNGTWSANTYPLTHRVDGYPVARKGSDFFPIISNIAPSGVRLHYRNRGSGVWQTSDGDVTPQCVPVEISGSPVMPNGTVGVPYSFSFGLTGTAPYSISGTVIKPAWMNVAISGSTVNITGTPTAAINANPVSIPISNACGNTTFADDFSTGAGCVGVTVGATTLSDAVEATAYSQTITLTGSGPFTLSNIVRPSWMTVAVSGSSVNITGTPTAPANNVTVSFTVKNACGTGTFSDTINVTPLGARFGATTFISGNPLNASERANMLGTAGQVITIEMDSYANTNGGQLQVNGVQVTGTGQTWNYTLNSSGQASFNVDVFGVNGVPGSTIFAHFRITAVSTGTTGTPDSYQISKAF